METDIVSGSFVKNSTNHIILPGLGRDLHQYMALPKYDICIGFTKGAFFLEL